MTNKEHFGDALKAARIAKGLSQQKLADLTGVTVVMVNRYEAGRAFPDLDKTMPKICKVLGVTLIFKLVSYHAESQK